MQTFLYNTLEQKREGPIRDGRYLVHGEPGPLPDGWVELEVFDLPIPTYNQETQTLEYNEYVDLQNKKWIKETYVRNLTQQEIDERRPKPPNSCTPRQFRLALLNSNIDLNTIENMLNNIPDQIERNIAIIEWEYSLEIKREHPLVSSFAAQLNITEKQLDDIFTLANTFD